MDHISYHASNSILVLSQLEGYGRKILDVVRTLRRMMYHPVLDDVVEIGDVDVENLVPYTELIGEGRFGVYMSQIYKSVHVAFTVSSI